MEDTDSDGPLAIRNLKLGSAAILLAIGLVGRQKLRAALP